jgi:hypothetical protein
MTATATIACSMGANPTTFVIGAAATTATYYKNR